LVATGIAAVICCDPFGLLNVAAGDGIETSRAPSRFGMSHVVRDSRVHRS
jgi:hypothetical protein